MAKKLKPTSQQKQTQRKFVVFVSLVSVLTFTSALLLALAPEPLVPDAASTLLAMESTGPLDAVFQTTIAAQPGRWKYIYIHQSKSPAGNALTLGQQSAGGLADHFVIANGDGAVDGEIQIGHRWDQQRVAVAPTGAESIDPNCVSICLIGNFDQTVPTPTQLRRLGQLVATLQGRYNIPADQVLLVEQSSTPAGIGKYFPTAAFREQLLQ